MIASNACPLVVAIDGYFYTATSNDGGDSNLESVMLHHIPLGQGDPQATRCMSAILLLELIAADEAMPVFGELTEIFDSKTAQDQTINGPLNMPRQRAVQPALKTRPSSTRNRPGLPSFDQPEQLSAA